MTRVLVTGSRDWPVKALLWDLLDRCGAETVIQGGCPTGADADARDWVAQAAWAGGITYDANWGTLGWKAGPVRNRRMVDDLLLMADHMEVLVLAFIKDQSKGATGCAEYAKAKGLPMLVYRNVPVPDDPFQQYLTTI